MSDFYTSLVLSVDTDAAVRTEAELSGQPSGLGWLADGRLLIVSMRDRRLLRREPDGSLVEHADLSALTGGPLNDMLVDSAGRAYVGNFGFDLMGDAPLTTANLVRADPDGATTVVAEDLLFPNGMALLDEGRTLVVAESFANRISAFTVGPGGQLSERRDWARFGEPPQSDQISEVLATVAVVPDGICAAPDGTIWVADAHNHRALRVAEGGRILAEVSTGELNVYACALGGPGLDTLFLCAAPSFLEHERRNSREAVLLAAHV
jgi:sugar lactone lactonase YvrE